MRGARLRFAGSVRDCGARCAVVAGVVGTVLTAVNNGERILGADPGRDLVWKVPLTYAIPFVVGVLGFRAGRADPAPGVTDSRPDH